ncbi:MAG: glycosyl transferase family 2 [Alteromonadaceae bacterium]|jgi:glycosyltransferase involved in cell wall biosynthesis|uniref:glycosyltransferase family 2 protein n=1 Tax=unclassified Methylophaga TaxID=2629249 RepID=UPI000C48BB7D|nr:MULTISPECIES: glycosyltransferase [unclassified Methylophaga]MAP27327.1 glycosyl transferase family 2 [Methylophaga sp.]MBN23471.1 glycosyl transferase family 2 [Alteromonadaceae bacterium]|tara:strand:- start:6937 stop:7854 length:918 start_codon:yes stop_codon:yes gene_type:complete
MKEPLVSVLMPVFNAQRFLYEAVQSILSQTLVNFELIIIDDGSKDDSYKIVETLSNIDKRIRLYRQNNCGISYTRNKLLSLAKADLIAWMDADDISHPTRLEKQYTYLQANKEYVAIGTSTIMIDEDGDEIFDWKAPLKHSEIDSFHMKGNGGAIIFPSSMMRKENVTALGGFNENLIGAEDLCLFLRLAEIGRLANLKENLFYYRQHIESICHSQKPNITENKLSVINNCKLRRGIVPNNNLTPIKSLSIISFNDIYLKWGWWAIKGKRFHTAKKYGFKVIRNNFFSRQAWLIVYFSILKKNIS